MNNLKEKFSFFVKFIIPYESLLHVFTRFLVSLLLQLFLFIHTVLLSVLLKKKQTEDYNWIQDQQNYCIYTKDPTRNTKQLNA